MNVVSTINVVGIVMMRDIWFLSVVDNINHHSISE